jgi:hypothetical protein
LFEYLIADRSDIHIWLGQRLGCESDDGVPVHSDREEMDVDSEATVGIVWCLIESFPSGVGVYYNKQA